MSKIILCLVLLLLSGTACAPRYVCPNGSEVADLSLCPTPKVVIDTNCRTTQSDIFSGSSFPDIVKGEITLTARDGNVNDVKIGYSLYGKTDKKLKYAEDEFVGAIQKDSTKTISFNYKPAEISEIWTGEMGFPGGIMGMNLKLKPECTGCEIEGNREIFCSS